jgi:yeast amino acid transporter
VGTFDSSSFVTTYFPIPFFLVLFAGYKLVKKTKTVTYEEMDFVSGSSFDLAEEEDTEKKSFWKKLSDRI